MLSKEKTMEAIGIMYRMFPNAECELEHRNPLEPLIIVILSTQATGVLVNKATPGLFIAFPIPEALAATPAEEITAKIKTIGLYCNRAKNVKAHTQQLLERFNGEVPQTRDELVSLLGVERRAANVAIGDAFDEPTFVVDIHVGQVSKRLRICKLDANVTEAEQTLMCEVPKEFWAKTHHTMIFFERYHCLARAPKCEARPLLYVCQEGRERIKGK